LKRLLSLLFGLMACAVLAVSAQRRPVLPQIDEPHPYYYREMYLPQLTSGPSSLTWSPDSKELIYSMAGSLWRQKLDSRQAVQLTDGAGYDYQPDWSPDGKSLVYVSYRNDALELWLLELASGKTWQLTGGGAVNVEPRWSPDGKKLVWVSTQYQRRFHVFMGEVKDGKLVNTARLTGETRSSLPRYYYSAYDMEINPVWTRDGKEILFVSNKGHIHGTGGFWLTKAQPGAEGHEIYYEETNWKARPDFSPDGSRIVYSSYLGRQWHNLWVMPAKGGDAFPISYGDWDETNARWSPDGTKMAAISNESGTLQVVLQTIPGAARQTLEINSRKFLTDHTRLVMRTFDESGSAVPARISITDSWGRFFCPVDSRIFADDGYNRAERATERHYFYTDKRENETDLPPGKYLVEVSGGLMARPFKTTVEAKANQPVELNVKLQNLEFSADRGKWVSCDFHVHMNYGGTYKNTTAVLESISRAEGIDIVHELVVNKEQRVPDNEFAQHDWVVIRGQEFHTSYWGHRGVLSLSEHLLLPGYAGYPHTAAASLYPMNADVYGMAHAQGALVGAVHPFEEVPDPFARPARRITDELPVDVALGKVDYMEIVGFSDHKSTAAVWYKLLNLGFKLPAGGGTDATTNYAAPIRAQVGADRAYVWTADWPTTSDLLKDGIRKGRTFATNGSLIDFRLGREMIGGELDFDAAQSAVPFTAKLRSIVPVDHLEVVCNGRVVQSLLLDGPKETADIQGEIPIKESGWCVLRAWSEKAEYPVMDNYAYATTSPVYVTIGGKRAYSKEDANYFKAWIDRTIEITDAYPDWNSVEEKQKVMNQLREARAVYEAMK
jgi:TolB protein